MTAARPNVRATMRLQFHKGFTFADATRLAPYMARLGISHLYSSPILTARVGSMHGYDVTDPTRINPELGGEDGFRHLVAALRAEGLGLIVDIVPNHMAVGAANPWWQDVLRHGQASPYARVFDIDWHPDDPLLDGKLLIPVLGRQYGEALAAGEIVLTRNQTEWQARYFDNVFPIAPRDHSEIERLSSAAYDPAKEEGRARLHRLLERQHYRLAWWRTAADEINWRRFFDINELVGVRVEDPEVFEATHVLLFSLYAEKLIDGVRIDHVDGLVDPRGYCRRLRARLQELAPDRTAYIVVEKILGPHEELAGDWNVDGTSGYDFMDEVSAVQHDPNAQAALEDLWATLSGRPAEFKQEDVAARRELLERSFTAPLDSAVAALHRVALQQLDTRDATRPALRRAVVELLAHFPVYRSYAVGDYRSESDAPVLAQALEGARNSRSLADPSLLELVVDCLRTPDRPARRLAATRLQQLSAPIAAKAVEDTAFYRYGRLLSRNDVGFDAARLGAEPAAFHRCCAERRARFPDAMLATATHDHKRGEDVRARLAVISEMPDEWGSIARRWMAMNAAHRAIVDGAPAPSPGDEIMLYQMILGAWPTMLDPADDVQRGRFVERIAGWQEKALREAKLATSWRWPNRGYETAAKKFLDRIMGQESPFPAEVARLADRIAPAGAVNGLAQVLLKLTVPGVPDFFQGTEFWDQSLVDPDNRRAVDFDERQKTLEAARSPIELATCWRDGQVKQALIARTLAARQHRPTLFARGHYMPLEVEGPRAAHVIAFARREGRESMITIVSRQSFALLPPGDGILIPPVTWEGTSVPLPAGLAGRYQDVVWGAPRELSANRLLLGEALAALPVALLVSNPL
jgi:(1->4)-alpha-D-glucan 1-alpha-D-glucosylmutase